MRKIMTFALALAMLVPLGTSAAAYTFEDSCRATGGTFNSNSGLCQYDAPDKQAYYLQPVTLDPGECVVGPDRFTTSPGTRFCNDASNAYPITVTFYPSDF